MWRPTPLAAMPPRGPPGQLCTSPLPHLPRPPGSTPRCTRSPQTPQASGARSGERWFQVQWDSTTAELPITVNELLPILLADILWGRAWRNHQVVRWCATAIIRQWSPVFAPALASTRVSCTHLIPRYINTHTNHLADDLSRNRVLSFLSKVPQVCPYLTLIPQDVISLLLDPQADWTSRRWQARFRDTLLKA